VYKARLLEGNRYSECEICKWRVKGYGGYYCVNSYAGVVIKEGCNGFKKREELEEGVLKINMNGLKETFVIKRKKRP